MPFVNHQRDGMDEPMMDDDEDSYIGVLESIEADDMNERREVVRMWVNAGNLPVDTRHARHKESSSKFFLG
eukprot:scaffold2917_cov191-Amphora_coffeaeformis.AAC.10